MKRTKSWVAGGSWGCEMVRGGGKEKSGGEGKEKRGGEIKVVEGSTEWGLGKGNGCDRKA